MSHTVKMAIEIKNHAAFAEAAIEMGGTEIGLGEHRLFQSGTHNGFAVSLPGWLYPVIATADGIKFDNYNGKWGKQATLDKLVGRYAIKAAASAAKLQGWYCEEQDGQLVIFHPDGGTITVSSSGAVSAACFEGRSCTEITSVIEQSLGSTAESQELKPEYFIDRQRVQRRESE